MLSGPSTSLRRLNSWIPDIWLPTGRFCPITKGPTCNSSRRRSCSSLGTWHSQGEPAVPQEELVKTTALLDKAMGWWFLGLGRGNMRGHYTILSASVMKSLRNEKFLKTTLLTWAQPCQKPPAIHSMWSASDTGAALVFFRVFTCIDSVDHHRHHFRGKAFCSLLDPGSDSQNQKFKLAWT